jgi:Mg-chelatase subunit ChlD
MGSRWPSIAAAGAILLGIAGAAPSCGARTSLPTPTPPAAQENARSQAFCASADYRADATETSLVLVLDKSSSMLDDQKWDQITAAIAAFVKSPENAGLAMGLVYFPRGSRCNPSDYATPAVPVGLLPGNAAAIEASLAKQQPDGDTPTYPALAGAIEHARALALADPQRSPVVALATDGAPNSCGSTAERVAEVARAGATTEPQVLTFVVGLLTGYTDALRRVAEAGGTGEPVLVSDAAAAAQEFASALRFLRETQASCRFALPATGSAAPAATDLAVSLRPTPGAAPEDLRVVASAADCAGGPGFFPDDLAKPTRVTLCPASCTEAHASPSSRVSVIAGCGAGAGDAGVPGNPDGGACGGAADFECVSACGRSDATMPVCVDGAFACPAGLVSTTSCTSCPPVPHGCCKADGTFAEAACLSGAWTCPPGATIFGTGSCSPPTVCARELPCPLGEVCAYDDFACGSTPLLGRCVAPPPTCPAGPAVCGCDGAAHTNACEAAHAGVDLDASGCKAPAGAFACGPLFCRADAEICRKTVDLAKALASTSFACIASTPACPSGCGCDACGPCPAGRLCKESCSGGAGQRVLDCTEL